MTANNAVLTEAVAAGRFRADLYHRLAVVVLTLPPSRTRGEDVVLLAEALLRHYTVAHGVPPKRLSASTHPWLQEYSWPGNVRELRHMMERVTLLHVGAENDATTLARLCLPQAAPKPSVEVIARPHEPAPEETLPAQAVQIRQALAQAGGNVTRAAQLLGVSRDTVRYRMQRCGIARPRLGAAGGPNTSQDAVIEKYVHSPEPAWQHTPVAVLALELTWPEASSLKFLRSDLWIETARWEETIGDKVQGFGGRLVQRVGSRRVWVFGVPQVLEQLPQRAVHSALAIRQLLVEASPGSAPLPHGAPGRAFRRRAGRLSGRRPGGAGTSRG